MTDINDIWRFDLRKGNSTDPRDGACLMDAVSWLEYGTLGDHPPCVCPVIATYARGVNDAMDDEDRQRLKVYLPRLVGTIDPDSEKARAEYLAWQAIHVFAPLALDTAGLHTEATNLRDFKGSLTGAALAARAAARAAAVAAKAAADAAKAAAVAAAWAAAVAAVHATNPEAAQVMISALDGVLKIGRLAEPVLPARLVEANERFELARA